MHGPALPRGTWAVWCGWNGLLRVVGAAPRGDTAVAAGDDAAIPAEIGAVDSFLEGADLDDFSAPHWPDDNRVAHTRQEVWYVGAVGRQHHVRDV